MPGCPFSLSVVETRRPSALAGVLREDLQQALARTLHITDVRLTELRRVHTGNRLDQNSDLILGTNVHAARERNANRAALEAALAGAFQFRGKPMARILSVVIRPATALLAYKDHCPAHRRFDIRDYLLGFTHGSFWATSVPRAVPSRSQSDS